jgi:NADH-quinone oxidoreductase subunit C
MRTEEVIQQLEASSEGWIAEKKVFIHQVTLHTTKESLKPLLHFFKDNGFDVLMDLTGVDYLEPYGHTAVVYFLHNSTNMERVRICLTVARDGSIPSVTDIWAGASWYEREVYDSFGVNFEGHPYLKRILMPDDWKGHPLRKDYALTEEPVEFKHGVKPKVPSEIIPHVKSYSWS